jgi:DNA-binding beta-propeller fold protein YncE
MILLALGAMVSLGACDEAPLIESDFDQTLNAPGFALNVPSSDYVLISNTNINLVERRGSVVLLNTVTGELLEESRTPTTNFGTSFYLDVDRSRLIIPDLDESLLFYDFSVTDDQLNLEPIDVSPKTDENIINGMHVDELPKDVLLVQTQTRGDLYLVSHQSGTIGVIDADDLTLFDQDPEREDVGFVLFSSLTADRVDSLPGVGAGLMYLQNDTGLVYVTNSRSNQMYVLDPEALDVEVMLDFSSIAGATVGLRDIVIDDDQRAYIAHGGLQSLLVVDVSGVVDNGVSYEVSQPVLIDIIPLEGVPNDLEINDTQDVLHVALQNQNEVVSISINGLTLDQRVELSEGRGPSKLYYDADQAQLWSLDFFSNTLTSFDVAPLTENEVIR